MNPRTLSTEDIATINLLESVTGARAVDVVHSLGSVLFVVKKGDLGKAIGKGGGNIRRITGALGRQVELIEEPATLDELLASAFAPARLNGMEKNVANDRTEAIVTVDPKSKGLAIGRNGEKIKRARLLAKRYFDVDEVRIF